ncbi:hypothetical protein SERLA73DRAFT_69687 [Serpula lacrymans var. lacrymans S7.3]|uniref:L-serine ammonia-lyase n=2 Tax=Serpula lacrymans var. lacrymans TaxID=341189 RepID=F8PKF0_SERL3|nr:uncharacterized protein SERLADRAFT_433748 [Serpula lacrymans var. lacrymans S7.9]EGO03864.1 hypothetical protein SERLA73DRAFT_69687 [Serpula lacrymans var. lacrymans S7.3]EGO29790.1 hypothetical protein SERLADRAFT_433748 [Serpula lacrymans var. lacrymans S7.9]
MSEQNTQPEHLWFETPLVYSSHISQTIGHSVYLKLENLQPSQSFKYRGVTHFAQHAKAQHGPSVHFVIASSGNAGVAAAMAARALEVRCTVYLPEGVGQETHNLLRKHGADIIIAGERYSQALQKLREDMKNDPTAVLLPTYDDPLVWEGHGSMVLEIKAQLSKKPDAIFCSLGGGGLLGGIIHGCKQVDWEDETKLRSHVQVPIITMETHGSNCFYHSIALNTQNFTAASSGPDDIAARTTNAPYDIVHDKQHDVLLACMHELTSLATSLGATSPSAGVVRMALNRPGGLKCVCVPDEMSMWAAKTFAEDHKFLVELACSTPLTAAYNRDLFSRLVPGTPTSLSEASSPDQKRENTNEKKTIVFIVCGGVKISLDEMKEYRKLEAAVEKNREWEVVCDGEKMHVSK